MYIHFIFRSMFGPSKRLLFRARPHTFQFVFAMMPKSSGTPQRETMFDHSAVPTPSGFKPTSASLNMQSMIEKKVSMATEAAFFLHRYREDIPKWWFRHSNNQRVITHWYRMIDKENGSDLICPTFPPAVCQQIVQDFSTKQMMLLALFHTSVQSGNPLNPSDQSKRPFLSFSLYFEKSHDFARLTDMLDARYGRARTTPDFVRSDCFVAWRMGYLQEHSFFDVSSLARATESHKNIRSCTECNDWKDS